MRRIHYTSDFKIVESWPGTEKFRYRFYTCSALNFYDVSPVAGNCRKATDADGNEKLVIMFDSHHLHPGQLKVFRELEYEDPDYGDSVCTKRVEDILDIKLVDGVSSDSGTVYTDGVFDIFRGEKGEKGESAELTDETLNAIIQEVSDGLSVLDLTQPQNLTPYQRTNVRTNIDVLSIQETQNKIDEEIGNINSLLSRI